MVINNFQDLLVWQKAMDLVELVYELIKKLPKEEMYELGSQMRRAAVSIPSNIAEGQERNSNKEFINFLCISRGSNAELKTQLLICVRLGYLTATDVDVVLKLSSEISRMLSGFIKKLKTQA